MGASRNLGISVACQLEASPFQTSPSFRDCGAAIQTAMPTLESTPSRSKIENKISHSAAEVFAVSIQASKDLVVSTLGDEGDGS